MDTTGDRRDQRRYRRAVRQAFAQVTFYREQWAVAGRPLLEPTPTRAGALPDPPHTLCPFSRPWSAEREPSLWTPDLRPLARALWLAGGRSRLPVLEVRDALLDARRLPGRWLLPGPPYRVLLSATATVGSPQRREHLNREALAVLGAAGGWLVGSPSDLASVPDLGQGRLRPVHRLPVAAAVQSDPAGDFPVLLHDPALGYLGARLPGCGRLHLDHPRVIARDRDGAVTISLPCSRRPTLLEIMPAGAEQVTHSRCPRHGTPILTARRATGG